MHNSADRHDIIGDGLHDDTAGIQALLDAGTSAVYLPSPPKYYLISEMLRIHSSQTLRLDPFTVIRLAPHSDTVMITNDDHDNGNENIALIGSRIQGNRFPNRESRNKTCRGSDTAGSPEPDYRKNHIIF